MRSVILTVFDLGVLVSSLFVKEVFGQHIVFIVPQIMRTFFVERAGRFMNQQYVLLLSCVLLIHEATGTLNEECPHDLRHDEYDVLSENLLYEQAGDRYAKIEDGQND